MIKYSKIVAKMVGGLMFFGIFFSVLFYYNFPPTFNLFFEKLLLAIIGAVIVGFWVMVAFDFLLKLILEDMDDCGVEGLLEGGIFQRFQLLRRQFMPGGEYMPFVKVRVGIESRDKENKKEKGKREKDNS
ncbi:MAG: hypothetical protein N2053_12590 [Chitinispirillaceae bacterium]|nr:hypothetical protein [Chitinispirillaceae bacterium]